jgi:hypothetical protein
MSDTIQCQNPATIPSSIPAKDLIKLKRKQLRQYLIRLSQPLPPDNYLLMSGGKSFMPLGELWAIKAKPKQGKTQAVTCFAAALLGSQRFGIERCDDRRCKVAIIDTEQSKSSVLKCGKRIAKMLNLPTDTNPKNLAYFSFRRIRKQERLQYTLDIIEAMKPNVLIVDGIVDLALDFNNLVESQDIISKLLEYSEKYACSCGFVIHTNKGKDDNNARGHLGTEIQNKCTDVFEVTKQGEGADTIYTLTHSIAREEPIQPISWKIKDDGELIRIDKDIKVLSAENREARLSVWRQVYAKLGIAEAGYNQLKNTYVEINKCVEKTAKNQIKRAVEFGILCKSEDGSYSLNKG